MANKTHILATFVDEVEEHGDKLDIERNVDDNNNTISWGVKIYIDDSRSIEVEHGAFSGAMLMAHAAYHGYLATL